MLKTEQIMVFKGFKVFGSWLKFLINNLYAPNHRFKQHTTNTFNNPLLLHGALGRKLKAILVLCTLNEVDQLEW